MPSFKKKIFNQEVPENFAVDTIQTIQRIEANHNVIGVMYLRDDYLEMYTIPEALAQSLYLKVPPLNAAVQRAVIEIDVQDEVVAYRIETNAIELSVANQKEFCACVVHKTKKKKKRKLDHT